MRRKNLAALLICSFCLAASCAAPAAVMAGETEVVTAAGTETEAAAEAETGTSAETEETAESESGAEEITDAETEMTVPERPDYEASAYVTLGDYKGLTVEVDPVEVTDEDVDEEIQLELQYSDQKETVTEGTVQEGDTVNIDYEGKKDGVAFDGGTAEDFDLVIGSHSFIDGFEDGLIGARPGETLDLPLTFPENYFNDLAGQDVVFTVTVNEIMRVPELTDEVAAAISDGEYSDAASFREGVRAKLNEYGEQQRRDDIKADLLTQVANICEINGYPQELMDYNLASMEAYYRSMAQMYSMNFEDFLTAYLGMSYDEFKEEAVPACQEIAQQELYIKAIAEAEGIELSDEEFASGTEKLAQQYGYESADALLGANDRKEVELELQQEKVFDFLIDNAIIVEPEEESEGMSEGVLPAELETDGQ